MFLKLFLNLANQLEGPARAENERGRQSPVGVEPVDNEIDAVLTVGLLPRVQPNNSTASAATTNDGKISFFQIINLLFALRY